MAVLFLLASIGNGTAQVADPEWEADRPVIWEGFRTLRCGEGAALLWKHVKRGNKHALLATWGVMYGAGLILPGLPNDQLYTRRLVLALIVHGYDASFIGAEGIFGIATSELARLIPSCEKRPERDLAECMADAKGRKIVPELHSFIDELKSYIDPLDPEKVVCVANQPWRKP